MKKFCEKFSHFVEFATKCTPCKLWFSERRMKHFLILPHIVHCKSKKERFHTSNNSKLCTLIQVEYSNSFFLRCRNFFVFSYSQIVVLLQKLKFIKISKLQCDILSYSSKASNTFILFDPRTVNSWWKMQNIFNAPNIIEHGGANP